MALLATFLLAAVVEASPRSYEIALEELLIPMHDGVSLAADLWRPQGAKPGARFPIVLEYLPYRKDEERASYFSLYSYLVRPRARPLPVLVDWLSASPLPRALPKTWEPARLGWTHRACVQLSSAHFSASSSATLGSM